MNPLSATVIGGSLLMSGPAWWAVYVDGTLSLEVALRRWLLCLVAVWAVLSLVKRLTDRALQPARPATGPELADETTQVIGTAFDTPAAADPTVPRDLAAQVPPDVAADVFKQMSPDMGTARRLDD